jgi:ubiquinone/menaquinone biosynthesis C-methylase UbiE
MPEDWHGDYLGVDLCPDTIKLAQSRYPTKQFVVSDLRHLEFVTKTYDWAVLISIKYTIAANVGWNTWLEVEKQLKRVAKNLLFLEWSIREEPDYGFERIDHIEWEREFQSKRNK